MDIRARRAVVDIGEVRGRRPQFVDSANETGKSVFDSDMPQIYRRRGRLEAESNKIVSMERKPRDFSRNIPEVYRNRPGGKLFFVSIYGRRNYN